MDELIFQVPTFVKSASATDMDANALGAVCVDGMRIDTKAAAWQAGAAIRKKAMAGEPVNPYFKQQIDRACDLFNITDRDYQLNPVACDHVVVKTASHTAEFFITDAQQLKDSASELLLKRASHPLGFCRECANALLDCAYTRGFALDRQDESDLLRLAGTAHFNKVAAADEIHKRIDYAINHNEHNWVERLRKLAGMVNKMSEDSAGILTTTVADAVDLFDRSLGLMNKLASEGLTRIEDAAFMTAEEALQKSASEPQMVDDEHSIPKGRLMVEATRAQMAKWASMQGYNTSTEASDILDCVASMPSSLREDFCNIFA